MFEFDFVLDKYLQTKICWQVQKRQNRGYLRCRFQPAENFIHKKSATVLSSAFIYTVVTTYFKMPKTALRQRKDAISSIMLDIKVA